MYDVLTIAAIADELTATVLDGRVQRVGLTDARSVAIEVYAGRRRRTIIASADTHHSRLYATFAEPALDTQLVTPLSLLLRKYVRGGVLVGIEQPPLERLVRMSIAKRPRTHNEPAERHSECGTTTAGSEDREEEAEETPDEGVAGAVFVHLMVEVMGKHSNIILVDDDGRIMESVKRVTPAMSRVRPILPRQPYVDPPPPDRRDPRRLTAAEMANLLVMEQPEADLAAVLTRRLRAVSPQMAREIAFRVAGDARIAVGQLDGEGLARVARETRHILEPLLTSAWQPVVYRDEENEVVAFAPFPMLHLAARYGEEVVPSISRAAELAEGGGETATPVRHAQRRDRLRQAIASARARAEARLTSIRDQEARAGEAERLRQGGELIYAYLWNIQPGQRELVVDGTTVPLDPAHSAKENAQAYFEQYRKAQSAGAHLPELAAKARTEVAYLDQLLTLVAQAERFDEIEALAAEWDVFGREAGRRGGQARSPLKRSAPPRKPRPLRDDAGNAIYVGRSGRENEALTFDIAGPNDTWLHARGVPGSHVIVRWQNPTGDEDEPTLLAAAALAAHYSAARGSGQVEVDATRRRFVRKIKGAGPGMVTYRNERTLAVRPTDESVVQATLTRRA